MHKEDANFFFLQKEVNKPMITAWERETLISEATWRLVDHRTTLRRKQPVYQIDLYTSTRCFQALLQEHKRWRVITTGEEIELILVEGHMREACGTIQRW